MFLRDRILGTTALLSRTPSGVPGNDESIFSVISDDGSWVAFTSWASDLVPGDTNGTSDIFLFEVATSTLIRVSQGAGGAPTTGPSLLVQISGDARFFSNQSSADNIWPGDVNGVWDVFL